MGHFSRLFGNLDRDPKFLFFAQMDQFQKQRRNLPSVFPGNFDQHFGELDQAETIPSFRNGRDSFSLHRPNGQILFPGGGRLSADFFG